MSFMHNTNFKLNKKAIQTGGFYIYKEKFGMTAVVKVIKELSCGDWTGYLLTIKRVLHASWEVPAGKTFEAGYNNHLTKAPSWQLEPYISLIPSTGKALCVNVQHEKDTAKKYSLSEL